MLATGCFICLSEDRLIDINLSKEDEETFVWINPKTKQEELILKKEERDIWFLESSELQLKKQKLVWNYLYPIQLDGKNSFLYAQQETQEDRQYVTYQLQDGISLKIGRKQGDICFAQPHISSLHACLFEKDGVWWIEDLHSSNGVYVNQKRILLEQLNLGDCIYLMGLKILMGNGFIAMNHRSSLQISDRLQMTELCLPVSFYQYPVCKIESQHMLYQPFHELTYECKNPPGTIRREQPPLLYQLGPSMTMSIASFSSAILMVYTMHENGQTFLQAVPSLLMAVSMIMGAMIWPLLSRRYEKRQEMILEEKRNCCYRNYLNQQKILLDDYKNSYAAWLWQFHEETLKGQVKQITWKYDLPQEVLLLCIGIGNQYLLHPFQKKDQPLTLTEDHLLEEQAAFLENPCIVKDVPLLYHITQQKIISVSGEESYCLSYAHYLILHHVLLYVPDSSCLVLAWPADQELDLPHFLPHQQDEEGHRFLCRDPAALSSMWMHVRKHHKPTLVLSFAPYFTRYFVQNGKDLPMAVVAFHPYGEAAQRISVGNNTGISMTNELSFQWENPRMYEEYMNSLSSLSIIQDKSGFPKELGFLAMYDVKKVKSLPIWERWTQKDSEYSLQSAIGISEDGSLLYLDLHEHAHGPHGIIAGMTGSGKSEFLITLLLSLAVSYHPYDCAFVLIDYKGGGMAKALEHLPHIAGIITNLDGNTIQRSLRSLHAEVLRRQSVFAKTMQQVSASSMDIDVYQKLHHESIVAEPLPHLVIVADEFAELKQQEPDFMEQLIRIARIGRSLGIHLLLATQKPSGVVDDQIWSNAHFHICLKVAEKADSMDMLKREEGVKINAVGRFYLQVGYDELFLQGQSAYVKRFYDPDNKNNDWIHIHELGDDGCVLRKWKRPQQVQMQKSELQAVLEEIQKIAQEHHIHPIQVWKDELSEHIDADHCAKNCIAMVDDPANQRQFPLLLTDCFCNTLLFAQELPHVQTALETILYTSMKAQQNHELHIVIIDGDQGDLCYFADAEEVYAAISIKQEDDLHFLMRYLLKKKQELKIQQKEQWLLIVHNAGALFEVCEDAQEWLFELARDHGRCNIIVMMSLTSTREIRMKLHQQFENLFVFQLHDEQEIHGLITGGWHLAKFPLRAIWSHLHTAYEVQFVTHRKQSFVHHDHVCMPVLKEHLSFTDFEQKITAHDLPIGIALDTRENVILPIQGDWIITGKQGAQFFRTLQKMQACYQLPMYLASALPKSDEIQEPMRIVYIRTEHLSSSLHHPYVQCCYDAGHLIWCGTGIEEYRYLWNLSSTCMIRQSQDAVWIKEEVSIFRRIE